MRYEVYGYMLFVDCYASVRPYRRYKRVFDRPACKVLGVDDPSLGMAALLAEVELMAVLLPDGELDPERNEVLYPRRAVPYHQLCYISVAEAGPRVKRVFYVRVKGVLGAYNGRYPALGIVGGGFAQTPLGHKRDAA